MGERNGKIKAYLLLILVVFVGKWYGIKCKWMHIKLSIVGAQSLCKSICNGIFLDFFNIFRSLLFSVFLRPARKSTYTETDKLKTTLALFAIISYSSITISINILKNKKNIKVILRIKNY